MSTAFAYFYYMTKEKLREHNSKTIRDTINSAVEKSDQVHMLESELIKLLFEIDEKRFFVRVGYKSLRGFCCKALNFSETQSQRIVTIVRRYEPTPNIGRE